ncbi:2702_t:CDS:2, partial [Funneliformis mosseae]
TMWPTLEEFKTNLKNWLKANHSSYISEVALKENEGYKRDIRCCKWKKSNKVRKCYNRLYDNNNNSIENIAKYAFSNISEDDESFNDIYTYTTAICNIVLNPEYPELECAKKPLE